MRHRLVCQALLLGAVLCLAPALPGASAPQARKVAPAAQAATTWVATWATSVGPAGPATQPAGQAGAPPLPSFADTTIRQIVHVSIGGSALRVRFSNAAGKTPLVLQSAHVARHAGGSAVRAATDRVLAFGGKSSVSIPEGASILSDPVDFDLRPLSELAITVYVRGVPDQLTGHPGSRTTSYFQTGDAASAPELPAAVPVDRWHFVEEVAVLAKPSAGAIAMLGDSITDGRGSTTNGNDRWTDALSRRLRADKQTADVAVLNFGIGGNRLLRDGLGTNALARFDRDVLVRPGVRWLIVLEGVNDIGTVLEARTKGESAATAADIIFAYEQIIARAHAHGIKVYGATIMPFEGFTMYYAPDREADRQTVNAWIKKGGKFDGVIDFDAATRDQATPGRLSTSVDGGDHLHPSPAGYRIMADAIDLRLFGSLAGRRPSVETPQRASQKPARKTPPAGGGKAMPRSKTRR
jgi:lysophospholipase L1-like esterase